MVFAIQNANLVDIQSSRFQWYSFCVRKNAESSSFKGCFVLHHLKFLLLKIIVSVYQLCYYYVSSKFHRLSIICGFGIVCFEINKNIQMVWLTSSVMATSVWYNSGIFVDTYFSPAVKTLHVPLCMQRPAKTTIFQQMPTCFRPSVCHTLGVPLCDRLPANAMPFQQIIMHALPCQDDAHLLYCFDLDLHITCSQGTTLCAAPLKFYAFSTNYHECA